MFNCIFFQVFDSNGIFVKEFGQYGSGEGEFDCLAGVAVNRIGQYIIADRYNHRIQVRTLLTKRMNASKTKVKNYLRTKTGSASQNAIFIDATLVKFRKFYF